MTDGSGDLRAELTLLARRNLASLDRREQLTRLIRREGDRLPRRLRNRLYARLVQAPYEAIMHGYASACPADDEDYEVLVLILVEAMSAHRGIRVTFGRVPNDVDDERLVETWVMCAWRSPGNRALTEPAPLLRRVRARTTLWLRGGTAGSVSRGAAAVPP